ncbi:polyprenyl synthetase family protein [Lactobacillus sp. PV034]|uniref:polyprenyl synthetase family protein n=1 Tax=Lactobacillus sp. PV034 TaxID=2594495 RepID=UPI00223F0CB9|nr:polyprenyl synthetase family protein [Lactobacillus sp. PV034]QNQ80262.1 polyprenyl synthetase family protein [Lactobacillus sp. PV034]
MMNLTEFRHKYTPIINSFLEKHLEEDIDNKKFSNIMAYSVMAGGKRLRPLIYLATLASLDHEINEDDIKTACGIELIHTYSLIHDDLPAMDNDDYRRGKLTSHKKWGEAEAILAGDALLPLGIQWIAQGSKNITEVEIITKAVGPNGMVGGQYLDIDSTNNSSVKDNGEFISKMEWLKTGCLLQASVEMAIAKVAETDKNKITALNKFAYTFGRSYQIYDDLVDVVESSQEAGKATHKDEAEGKNNTFTLLGLDESRQELIALVDEGKKSLDIFESSLLAEFFDLYQKVL